jgi:hypothetical protein
MMMEAMADPLYLSYWLRNFSALSMLRSYGKMLTAFPYSPQNPAHSLLRIEAVSTSEPPLLERPFADPLDPQAVLQCAHEFQHPDCAYVLETWWGLWQFRKDWELRPARVTLSCYGPEFSDIPLLSSNTPPEHLRIDCGLDSSFLPWPDDPASAYYTRSNLRGLLRLVHQLDEVLSVEQRLLWSESGESFAGKLADAIKNL